MECSSSRRRRGDMDVETRAARRPMPRQMDASDWRMDTGGGATRNRGSDVAREVPRRQADEQLRATSTLRPVNRYDSHVDSTRLQSESAVQVPTGRASSMAYERWRPMERSEELAQGSRRPPPRSVTATLRREAEPTFNAGTFVDGYSQMQQQASRLSGESTTPALPMRHSIASDSRRQSYEPRRAEVLLTPPREQVRDPSPPNTASSSASTALTSSPFSPSLMDTSFSGASLRPTPPASPPDNIFMAREEGTISESGSVEDASTRSQLDVASSDAEQPPRSSPPLPDVVSSSRSATPVVSAIQLTPQQQREQLYAFRGDMRQIFARVDEMVDMHRDMFKSDLLSGVPAFNADVARDTQAFASETFAQLTSLRARFEQMTKAWVSASETTLHLNSNEPISSTRASTSAAMNSDTSNDSIDSNWRRLNGTHRQSTMSESSLSQFASSTPSATDLNDERSRWEPSISNLSDDDSSSSSISSKLGSFSEVSSSLSSDLPTLSRPSTGSSAAMTRANVFEDFDRRMEDIRASLNAIAREKSRTPSMTSRRVPVPKPSTPTHRDEADRRENNPSAGNQIQRENQQTHSARHDREARLRQLLLELQSAGDSDAS